MHFQVLPNILQRYKMWSQARDIAANDIVIVWFTRDNVKAITITPGTTLAGQYGVYDHDDLIGKPYGSKVGSRNGKGFIHLLRPTPELWTLALPHRTQILYAADIAFITSWLGISPGSVVIEAGTGSGSFSHSVARTIGTKGHLHSFEFHEIRCQTAQKEFENHGMSEIVTLRHRNVCKTGFDLTDTADAVFLDLPAPWEAIPFAKEALKKSVATRICCFSPCMEQVLRTVSALNDAGFTQITMYETLLRTMDVSIQPKPKSIAGAVDRLRGIEVRKEERRLRQIEANERQRKAKQAEEEGDGSSHKRKGEADEDADAEESGPKPKRLRQDHANAHPTQSLTPRHAVTPTPTATLEKQILSKPFAEQRGHTSYLTFAVLLPTVYPGSILGSTSELSSSQQPTAAEDAVMDTKPPLETVTQTG